MHRTVYFAGVALFLVTVAFLLTDHLVWRPGVTEANVRRIREGMTRAQVEAILGRSYDKQWHIYGDYHLHVWAWIDGDSWALVRVGDTEQVIDTKWWVNTVPRSLYPPGLP